MNRKELEHAIRAACSVSDDIEVYVIGSQSILGAYPEAPSTLLTSMEVDLAPKNKPHAWEEIDGCLGELSMFHDTHHFYVQGLEISAAKLASGWEHRCIAVRVASVTGWCLHPNDLALAKLAARRPKDLAFVRTLIIEHLVDSDAMFELIPGLPLSEEAKEGIKTWLSGELASLAGLDRP